MDLLFGTYVCPDHEPERFGLREPTARSYLGHLVLPLLPRWRKKKPPVAAAPEPEAVLAAVGE